MSRVVIYDDEVHIDVDAGDELVAGTRLEVYRGNGPREGDRMGTATVTAVAEDGGVSFIIDP